MYYGYPTYNNNDNGSWLWIVLIVFIILFLFWGNNGCGKNNGHC